MKEKRDNTDAKGNQAITSTELVISSSHPGEHEKITEIIRLDETSESSIRQPAGPRTELGKQRSSRNAIKHGIFSKAILLRRESRAEFDSLRTDLWEAVQPVGRFEELLVDKLASLSWRYRRFLLAETGEIRRQFLEWSEDRSKEKDEIADSLRDDDCLRSNLHNSDVLKRCLELLAELREGIKTTGFSQKRDTAILQKIYGDNTYSPARLQSEYSVWSDTAQAPEEERLREGYATPEDCKSNVLDEIDAEIRRLKTSHKRRKGAESERADIDLLRRNVPDSLWLDRVTRYEASLERAFDRTLSQLERLQRLRLGQPVAPRIDLNIAG